jgi:hypothetical protein
MSNLRNVGGKRVTNAADPVNAQDLATRAYVLANPGTPTTWFPQNSAAPPAAASWTVVNSIDNVSIADAAGRGIELHRDGASVDVQWTGYRVPIANASTFTVCAGMSIYMPRGNTVNGGRSGPLLAVSDGTKYVGVMVYTEFEGLSLPIIRLAEAPHIGFTPNGDSPARIVFGSNDRIDVTDLNLQGKMIYPMIIGDGTNLKIYVSRTGRKREAQYLYTATLGDYLGTITHAAILMVGFANFTVPAVPTDVWVPHWQNSTP